MDENRQKDEINSETNDDQNGEQRSENSILKGELGVPEQSSITPTLICLQVPQSEILRFSNGYQ